MTAHAGKDGEKGKHSSIAVRNANLNRHYGNPYGSYPEK